MGTEMYFLLSGTVMEVHFLESGEEQSLFQHVAGSHFGDLALLSEQPQRASVRAVTFCNMFMLGKDDLFNVLVRRAVVVSCDVDC